MKTSMRIILSCLVVLLFSGAATPTVLAVDVDIDFGLFPTTSGGQLTGPGFAAQPFGTGTGVRNFTGLTNPGNYSMDFFHNSGAGGSDFQFTFDGANITSVGLGGGTHTMVTGFSPGTSLTLNTNSITYNANQGQTGNYFIPGLLAAQGTNSAPAVVTAIPGIYSVDNLYNSGGGNEDYRFIVNSDGSVSASPGSSGALGIPHSEYATFSGSDVNVRSETVSITAETSSPLSQFLTTHPKTGLTNNGSVVTFDMEMTVGTGGVNFAQFGSYSITSSNMVQADGTTPWQGFSSGNDYHFRPLLRFDGTSNANGFYWMGAGPGFNTDATGTAVGFFDGDSNPLTVDAVATLPAGTPPVPEPSTFLILGLGMLGLVKVNRRCRTRA